MAFIHAAYATAWAAAAVMLGLPLAGSVVLLLVGLGALLLAGTRLAHAMPCVPVDDNMSGRSIKRINVVTGIVACLVIVACHLLHADRWLVPGVLAVMAFHFVPLWRLLGRLSLLLMGVALLVAAIAGVFATSAAISATAASVIFLANSVRILFAGKRKHLD